LIELIYNVFLFFTANAPPDLFLLPFYLALFSHPPCPVAFFCGLSRSELLPLSFLVSPFVPFRDVSGLRFPSDVTLGPVEFSQVLAKFLRFVPGPSRFPVFAGRH